VGSFRVVFGALHQALSVTIGMAAKMANIGTSGNKYGAKLDVIFQTVWMKEKTVPT
jgi:hypothetical protein